MSFSIPSVARQVLSVGCPADRRCFQTASLPASPEKSLHGYATDCPFSSILPGLQAVRGSPQSRATSDSPVLPREQVPFHAFMHFIHPNRVAFHFTWSITLHRKIQTCIRSISQSKKKSNQSEGQIPEDIVDLSPRSPELSVESRFPSKVFFSSPQKSNTFIPLRASPLFFPLFSTKSMSTPQRVVVPPQ